jgi:glutathione S-transferase
MLKIYGHPGSTCTRKVLMTAAETHTPFEFTLVDLAKGEQKQMPHLARQPFGHIPAIDDDGFEMFESRAIARYLNAKAKGPLVPSDVRSDAKMEQWISSEASELSPNAMKFVYKHVMKRPVDDATIEAATKGLETTLAVMEKQLAQTPYLVGDSLTLADIFCMPYFEYMMMTPAKEMIEKHPAVAAWWGKISARPAWQKVKDGSLTAAR